MFIFKSKKFVGSPDMSKWADLIVKPKFPIRDVLIGIVPIIAGCTVIARGIARNSVNATLKGYDEALVEAGCLDEKEFKTFVYDDFVK